MKATLLALPILGALAVPHGRSNGRQHARQVANADEAAKPQIFGGLPVQVDEMKSITHTGAVAAIQTAVNKLLSIPIENKGPPLPKETWAPKYGNSYTVPDLAFDPVMGSKRVRTEEYKKLTQILPKVLANGNKITDKSWELGALVQGILEVYNPELTTFEYDRGGVDGKDIPWNALKVAMSCLYATDFSDAPSDAGVTGDIGDFIAGSDSAHPLHPRPLVGGDGALGDPAANSAGTLLLAQYAARPEVKRLLSMRDKEDYAWAVANQWVYLDHGLKSDNGTISQRESHFELWADMGYMIPPSFAAIGLYKQDTSILRAAVDQWNLESSALFNPDAGLWRHVHYWDSRLWATGQAWMLGGGLRVLTSVLAAGAEGDLARGIKEMEDTLVQALYSVLAQLDQDNLVPNYMHEGDPALAHGDAAGTALIIASAYRFYALFPERCNDWFVAQAEKGFNGVVDKLDDEGWVHQVVDPDGTNGFIVEPYRAEAMQSPEAQAFSGMMWAARTQAGI